MELVPVLRLAWRRRVLLAVGVLLAVAAGLAAARSEAPERWTASARLVLDTPASQIVDAAPRGADTLGWRARVLAARALGEDVRARIARDAGVPVGELATVYPSLGQPLLPATLPRRAAEVADAVAASAPYQVTVSADGDLPFVTLVASAPGRAQALELAEAARVAVAAVVPPYERGSAGAPNVVVEPLGAVAAVRAAKGGPSPARALMAGVLVFVLWCALVLTVSAAAAARRRRGLRAPGAPPGRDGAGARRRGWAGRGRAA